MGFRNARSSTECRPVGPAIFVAVRWCWLHGRACRHRCRPGDQSCVVVSPRVTMADVAKRAGVHVTTVSLALRSIRRPRWWKAPGSTASRCHRSNHGRRHAARRDRPCVERTERLSNMRVGPALARNPTIRSLIRWPRHAVQPGPVIPRRRSTPHSNVFHLIRPGSVHYCGAECD